MVAKVVQKWRVAYMFAVSIKYLGADSSQNVGPGYVHYQEELLRLHTSACRGQCWLAPIIPSLYTANLLIFKKRVWKFLSCLLNSYTESPRHHAYNTMFSHQSTSLCTALRVSRITQGPNIRRVWTAPAFHFIQGGQPKHTAEEKSRPTPC